MQSLYLSIRSEFYKSRKTLAFWAAILLPLVICGLVTLGIVNNTDRILRMNPGPEMLWMSYISSTVGLMGVIILPFYVIFMAFSVNNIEHKNDTWKSLFSQPLNRFSIYAAKYFYAVILVFICLFLFASLTYSFGYFLHTLNSKLRFNEYDPFKIISETYLRLFISSMGILSLQFVISLIWSDFLKPMGIGFIGIIIGMITATKGWEYAYLIPYSHPTLTLSAAKAMKDAHFMTRELWSSLIYAIVLFIAGYFIVARKSVK